MVENSWTNCNNNRMNSWTNCNNNTSKNEVWSADDCWRYELVKNEARRMMDEARSTLCSEVKWNEVKWSYVILDELACKMSNLKPWYELFQLQPDLNETNQRCFKHPTFYQPFRCLLMWSNYSFSCGDLWCLEMILKRWSPDDEETLQLMMLW